MMETDTTEKAFYAMAVALIWLVREMWVFIRKGRNGNGNGIHKSFADNEDHYWDKMKDVVTFPLSQVLKSTNEILSDLRDRAIKEEGRQEALRQDRLKKAHHG